MTEDDRIPRWLADLEATVARATALAARGREAFDRDDALPLAFEALSNRIGELAKRFVAADGDRFSDPIWRQAARHRDYVVHHYDRLDEDVLWRTVTESFPRLQAAARSQRG